MSADDKPDSVLFMGATPEQISTLADHLVWFENPGWLHRKSDAVLIADLAVYYVSGSVLTAPGQQRRAYDYAHGLRRELTRRKLLPVPDLRIPRCEVCKHGTEKLFATAADTHGIVNSSGETVFPNVCVRCWSRLHRDSEESE